MALFQCHEFVAKLTLAQWAYAKTPDTHAPCPKSPTQLSRADSGLLRKKSVSLYLTANFFMVLLLDLDKTPNFCAVGSQQVWPILPALELREMHLLNWSHRRRSSSNNAGKLDQTWSTVSYLLANPSMPADPIQPSWVEFIVDTIVMHRIQAAVP